MEIPRSWTNHSMSHYNYVIMGAMVSQITSLTIVYSAVHSDADQRKHQSSASLAFVWGINRGPMNSPHKWPLTRTLCPFDDVIMRFTFILLYRLILLTKSCFISVIQNKFRGVLLLCARNLSLFFICYMLGSQVPQVT